jgi:arginine/lysine/ornithine decarboxylase
MKNNIRNSLESLAAGDLYPFHMPGHKRQMPGPWYAHDISEITGFDNLHCPTGILADAQKKAAALYGAKESYYLINGSTVGVLAAVSAVFRERGAAQKLLLARNSHVCASNAAYLNRLETTYLDPPIDEETGIARGVSAELVAKHLDSDPDIEAVFVTSPTYEGAVSDIAGIAAIVHRHNIPLIVDEAHGAHFGFHPAFPPSSVQAGADLVVHGLHKTLPALTQTALLHKCSARVDSEHLQKFLHIFQSTSPSYPRMAGIEACLDLIKEQGEGLFAEFLAMRERFVDRISQLAHIRLAPLVDDPCKLVFIGKDCVLDGPGLAQTLHDRYRLEMEKAEKHYVIAIITIMDKAEGLERLAAALGEIDGNFPLVLTR